MTKYITLSTSTSIETQLALEHYGTTFNAAIKETITILRNNRSLLFSPTSHWFETLHRTIKQVLPPTVSHDLLDTAKWDTIDEYVPSNVKDSPKHRFNATINVLTTYLESFATAHHATTTPDSDTTKNHTN